MVALMATSCEDPVGPEGLVPPGTYVLVRANNEQWEVPAPPPLAAVCGFLIAGQYVIDADGNAVHTRTIETVAGARGEVTQQVLRTTLGAERGSDYVHAYYSAFADNIRVSVEPTAEDPNYTVLTIDQSFLRNRGCPGRSYEVRYVRVGPP